MVTKTTRGKSPEERTAEMERLQATIVEQVETLRDTEQWTRYLAFVGAFHRYSINNLLLIFGQRPDATQVAGYRTWQALGRQVRKGERGIRIYGGREIRTTEQDERTGEDRERIGRRFFPVSVFDQSQTDPTAPDPASISRDLEGDDPGILAAVTTYLTGQGWTVEREQLHGGTKGYATIDGSRRVVIASDLSPAQAAKTALHEAAHTILHADEEPGEYVEHRGIKETEAESVAYVVAAIAGLDTSDYSIGYVAGWSKADADTIKGTAANVLRAAHILADAIAPAIDVEQAA